MCVLASEVERHDCTCYAGVDCYSGKGKALPVPCRVFMRFLTTFELIALSRFLTTFELIALSPAGRRSKSQTEKAAARHFVTRAMSAVTHAMGCVRMSRHMFA